MTATASLAPVELGPPPVIDKQLVHVLLVDDNPSKRLALKAVLAPLGYSIVEADSGIAALRCVTVQDFAVILLDVCMPETDGFETAALIRKRQQCEMTPIIFFTAFSGDDIAQTDRYVEGAVDFIFAPVAPEEIRAKVSVFANLFLQAGSLATRAQEVQTSVDQLRLLTDAAPIGIFQVDAEKRYVYANPRWSEIVGIPAEQAIGQVWDTNINLERLAGPDFEQVEGDPLQAELGQRFKLRIPGEAPRIVLVISRPIPDADGGIAGWVGTIADISADALVEAALSDARDKANEASQLKSDFLANMSHEIRTPMNGVIGMTDLLLRTDLDVQQRDYAQTVRNSGEALLTIIDDILDFSKVEAGQIDIENIDFNVHAVIQDVVDLLAGPVQFKGLELVAVIEKAVPSAVQGDPGRVRQVLTNLIGNAIKFTHTGEIVVRVTKDEVAGAAAVIRFEVSDTGDGIESEKLDSIFQPFVQADTSTSRKYGGTGLGLAISRRLVDLMGGDCGVQSEVGVGSTFWFTIAVGANAGQATESPRLPDAELSGIAALIVEDNEAQRAVLCDYLTDWGMSVTTVGSGAGALVAMRAAASDGRPFGVVVVDQSMPGMDGLELNDAIVGDPALNSRVVLMADVGHQLDAAVSGAVEAVSKPVHHEDLRAALRVASGMKVVDTPGIVLPAPRSQAEQPISGHLLLAEDNPINQKVAIAMLSSVGYTVDAVSTGLEALEAVADRNYDVILMDCQMPELSGYEATTAIRAQEGSERHTPIIALTAGARGEDRERCLAAGMDSYLSKPLNMDVLLALVAKTIESGSIATDGQPVSRAPAEIMIDRAVLDELSELGELGDPDFLGDVIDQFVRETEPRLVELREALAGADAHAAVRISHLIQGSACQLGGRRLALSCDRLEGNVRAGLMSEAANDLRGMGIDYEDLRHRLMQLKATVAEEHVPRLHV